MKRIMVIVPCHSVKQWTDGCRKSIDKLLTDNRFGDFDIKVNVTEGTVVHMQYVVGASSIPEYRHWNISISETRVFPYEWDLLLCINPKSEFEVDDVVCLINHDKDIVSGCPYSQFLPHCKNDYDKIIKRDGIYEVDYVPFHFTLIKREVLRKIKYPWWKTRIIKTGEPSRAIIMSPEEGFCMSAKEAGIKIYNNFGIEVYQ